MDALAGAIGAAALALAAKILYDMWVRHQERRGIAGALAGEIGAYITLLKPMQTADSFRKIATIERKERVKVLRAMPAPPNNHPVFDAVAHKIGLLSAQDALDTSAFYNVVTGFRIHVTNFASEKFLDAQDEIHTGLLNSLAETIEAEAPKVELLVKRLQRTASERFWSRNLVVVKQAAALLRKKTESSPSST